MRSSLFKISGIAVLATGMLFAQSSTQPAQPPRHRGAWQGQGQMGRGQYGIDRLAASLNLTDAQKQQAQTIFDTARQQAQPIDQQLRQERLDLSNAVKNGATDTQIDSLTSKMAPLIAQTMSIHTKAFEKFYSLLTPDQKTKLGDRMSHFMGGGMPMMGMHRQMHRPANQ